MSMEEKIVPSFDDLIKMMEVAQEDINKVDKDMINSQIRMDNRCRDRCPTQIGVSVLKRLRRRLNDGTR